MHRVFVLLSILISGHLLFGRAEKMRVVWHENPSRVAHVGWSSTTSQTQTLYVDMFDHGKDTAAYAYSFKPEKVYDGYKGMLTQFVRLENLFPDTKYYLVWGDRTSLSSVYFFETAPEDPTVPISLIVGGDSRNNRAVRQFANVLVGRLRPDAVLFAGDMTDEDKSQEWQEWLDDWQLTRGADRRLIPIIPARGNHERSNEVMRRLFDVPGQAYYAQTLGGSLLRVYTLNSEINVAGSQAEWLEDDLLQAGSRARWRIAQYHKPIRPHVARKREGTDQYMAWAHLFSEHGVQLVYECDGHVAKVTWPVVPRTGAIAQEGFIRDDRYGTIYLGEGGWGAPLREVDDRKPWTRAAGSFNHFNWLWVTEKSLEIRTVKIPAGISEVLSVSLLNDENRFSIPRNLELWQYPDKKDFIEVLFDKRESDLQTMLATDLNGVLFEEEKPSNQKVFFTAYRNPLAKPSELSVACFSREKQSIDLRLFDQRGKELFYRKHRILEGDNRFRFNTGIELSGVYYLAIQHSKGSQVVKLVLD